MPATQSSAPFFAANLLATASDGTWRAIRRARRVEAFDDHIEIDGRKIFYPWLRDIRAYGNVLHIEYVLGDGRPVTECFLYNALLSVTGARRLDEMVARVAIALKRQEVSTSAAALPRSWVATILAEPLTDVGGRAAVAVHSSRVAFPPVCPMCIGDPTNVAALRVSSGISERRRGPNPTVACAKSCNAHDAAI